MKWLAGFCQKNPLIRQAGLLASGMTQVSPFRYIKTPPEIIRLAVTLYIRFPLSLRNVEGLLREQRIDIGHETVWFCWSRFGPLFASSVR